MGNRAVITTESKRVGIYLHWNGGRDSIEGFLKYCQLRHFRSPESDNYGWARLTQVIANTLGGDLSLGIDRYESLDRDNGDNGVYLIKNWEIVGREYFEGTEQAEYDLLEFVLEVDDCQPKNDRLGHEYIIKHIGDK